MESIRSNDKLQIALDESKFKLLNSYVPVHNRGEFPAGRVIFNEITSSVIKHPPESYRLITNKHLVNYLATGEERIRVLETYISTDNNTFILSGIFPEIYEADNTGITVFLGFEIQNSMNLRFLPSVTLAYHIYNNDVFVRTPLRLIKNNSWLQWEEMTDEVNTGFFSQVNEFISFQDIPIQSNALDELFEKVPEKIRLSTEDTVKNIFKIYGYTAYNYIVSGNLIAKRWARSNYEMAVKYAKRIYVNGTIH